MLSSSTTDETTLGNITLAIGTWESSIDDMKSDVTHFSIQFDSWVEAETISTEDAEPVRAALDVFNNAVDSVVASPTRTNELDVLIAYIDLYPIMTDLTAKYGSNS